MANKYDIPLTQQWYDIKQPPWKTKDKFCDTSLAQFNKAVTPPTVFYQLFSEKRFNLIDDGWNFIYTDGSKEINSSTSYAIVKENGTSVMLGHLYNFSSIFTAEALAILKALTAAKNAKIKTVICTDSLSVIKAVRSPNRTKWNIINAIKDLILSADGKLKLLWIPGHSDIPGNNYADESAKFACKAPMITDTVIEKVDLKNHITTCQKNFKTEKWHNYQHPYFKFINPKAEKNIYPIHCHKKKIKIFSRLRLGHTITTHQHLRLGTAPPNCQHCNERLTVRHILTECTGLSQQRHNIFQNKNPIEVLQNISLENIELINTYVNCCKYII